MTKVFRSNLVHLVDSTKHSLKIFECLAIDVPVTFPTDQQLSI